MTNQHRREMRLAWRAAHKFVAGVPRPPTNSPTPPYEHWQEFVACCERVNWLADRNFNSAADENRWLLNRLASSLIDALLPLKQSPAEAPEIPAVREVFAEIVALREEFGDVEFQGDAISVTTAPIELEGLDLGPFEIKLQHNRFFVIAAEPCESATNSDVTHPHVSGDQLCAGWGAEPIAAALTDGRLSDFFVIVRQVLESYNPESAYVRIGDWHGQSCEACDYVASVDTLSSCSFCDTSLCEECQHWCERCEVTICHFHSAFCRDCGDRMCRGCQQLCSHCEGVVCSHGYEGDLCNDCRESRTDDDAGVASEDAAPPEMAATAADAHGVGQVGVLA